MRPPHILVTWRRTKGGTTAADALEPTVSEALLAWLRMAYGAQRAVLPADAPIWFALSRNVRCRPLVERAMTTDAIADVYSKRLGVSKVHTGRHTFAAETARVGVCLTDIQARLGHSNAARTGIYLQALQRAENPDAGELAALLGFSEVPPNVRQHRRPRKSRPALCEAVGRTVQDGKEGENERDQADERVSAR